MNELLVALISSVTTILSVLLSWWLNKFLLKRKESIEKNKFINLINLNKIESIEINYSKPSEFKYQSQGSEGNRGFSFNIKGGDALSNTDKIAINKYLKNISKKL